jgi:16S rRNA (cytidine1402-2'-O)-methyltransferase
VNNSAKFVFGTMPIGDSRDISLRMLDALATADLIVCENLDFFENFCKSLDIEIRGPVLEYTGSMDNSPEDTDEHLNIQRAVLSTLEGGKFVLYISDEGAPGINDPGSRIGKVVRDNGYLIDVYPGPSVVTSAYVHSLAFGHMSSFSFGMFENNEINILKNIKNITKFQSFIFTTSPSKFDSSLVSKLLFELGDRDILICHSMTTPYQKIIKVRLSQVMEKIEYENGPSTVVILPDNFS